MSRPTTIRPPLTPDALGPDPFAAFHRWMEEAESQAGLNYANAMTLSTISPDGWPESRIVLLKGLDPEGFLFFTNFESEKGRALATTPRAALAFYWDAMGRQVRVQGSVEPLPAERSDAYFQTRPRGSRIGAWASMQSREIPGREGLEERYRELEAQFGEEEVPRPDHWGGYVVRPVRIEFWQDAPFRLHDRILYRWENGEWRVVRLSP